MGTLSLWIDEGSLHVDPKNLGTRFRPSLLGQDPLELLSDNGPSGVSIEEQIDGGGKPYHAVGVG